MDQHSRMATLADFKAGRLHALVATDVAARGLDIKSIKTVGSRGGLRGGACCNQWNWK
jgi:superfamily II DNA/RNA helicase